MTTLTFPESPTLGDLYVGTNSITYQWMGTHWSSANPAIHGFSMAVIEGGVAGTVFSQDLDNQLEGGGA